jgi:hypothetical protein
VKNSTYVNGDRRKSSQDFFRVDASICEGGSLC